MLSEAKTAITSWMLSVCFTSIAFQSLLACPGDIGHIFHSTVKDWHREGKGELRGGGKAVGGGGEGGHSTLAAGDKRCEEKLMSVGNGKKTFGSVADRNGG